jgi:hypothetical protein
LQRSFLLFAYRNNNWKLKIHHFAQYFATHLYQAYAPRLHRRRNDRTGRKPKERNVKFKAFIALVLLGCASAGALAQQYDGGPDTASGKPPRPPCGGPPPGPPPSHSQSGDHPPPPMNGSAPPHHPDGPPPDGPPPDCH